MKILLVEDSKQNQFTYSAFLVYLSEMSTGTAYTLKNGETSILSWTQSSSSVTIS